jgi:biopolymer transport protein ExbD
MDLFMPKDGPVTNIADSKSMTILIGAKDQLYYYFGAKEKAFANNSIQSASYLAQQGIRDIIRQKQKSLGTEQGERKALFVVIKAGNNSDYKHVVRILDEMLINGVTDTPCPIFRLKKRIC